VSNYTGAAPASHTPSRACYLRGCRQAACKNADYQYMSALRLDHHRGQRRRTDATQTRHHIERLQAAGWTQAQIGRAAGIAHRTVGVAITATSVSTRTARAILNIPIGPPPADTRDVDATGTTRRVRALVAIGWPLAQLAPRFGLYTTALGRIANAQTDQVRAVTADTIALAYRHLARTPGPSIRARQHAAARGWYGPTAWDDRTIDDPEALPDADGPEPVLSRDELAALRRREITHLAGYGATPEEIADRLGMGVSTVTGVLRQHRRTAA
jgi:DNA-binding NarL/FixJ family response regulator